LRSSIKFYYGVSPSRSGVNTAADASTAAARDTLLRRQQQPMIEGNMPDTS